MTYATLKNGKTVVLVNGVPASGKSTISRLLSEHFALPYLTIDGIKEPFMDQFEEIDRAFNRRLGCAAYEVIWSIIGSAPTQCIFLIDAWFGFQSKEKLQHYLDKAGVTQVIEVWNHISGDLASKRYALRLGERRNGHPGEEYLPELIKLADGAKPMALGPVFEIDQARPVDASLVIEWLDKQLS
jgi:predicted NBD/HSP70 family sugar kinase